MFLGLRSLIYPTNDIEASKAWYNKALGVEPYFDQPSYAGYNVGGHELGLFAKGKMEEGPKTYWGVESIDDALARLVELGSKIDEPITDVGGGIRMAAVLDNAGFSFGLIENPVVHSETE